MKPLWAVFVLIWYICVNENYLFTRAVEVLRSDANDYYVDKFNNTYTNFTCKDSNITIHNIAIEDLHLKTTCISPTCDLIRKDLDNDIDRICNGSKACLPDIHLHTSCLLSHSNISISYICISKGTNEKKYDFEEQTSDLKIQSWVRYKAESWVGIIRPTIDHSSVLGNGKYLSIESGKNDKKKGKVTYKMTNRNIKCLIFWYYMKGNNIESFSVQLNRMHDTNLKDKHSVQIISEGKWIKKSIDITHDPNYAVKEIVLEANINGSKSCVAVDDIYITSGSCSEIVHEYKCLEMNGIHTFACPALYPYFSEINVKIHPQVNTSDDTCKDLENQLANSVNESCTPDNSISNNCTFSLKSITESRESCLLHRNVHLNYSCTDTSISISTKVPSTEQTGTSIYVTTERQYISTFSHTDVISPLKLPNSSSIIGIVIGVILPMIAIAVGLVIAVVYFRRSRYLEKKGHSIVVNEDSHSDYTGHQNIAFSPEVNVTTQTDYCEIRKSKLNEHYHDIPDTFSPSINTEKDDEYSEIANVVNSPNSNSNASTNYQHQYITLDPNTTGFNRSNPQTNLNNESKNNHDSNEKTSFTGGDDYAILDPDDLNESINNTPKVLPLSDNYVVLDPNETGFNRQENTDRVCNYDLAEDPYDVSKDETYDTSSNSHHKEKENNIYSHTVDNVYDTAGNQRKKEGSDGTYDHFFGQKSEDDYDISKPI